MSVDEAAQKLIDQCAARALTLSVAESLTGGALADAFVRVPGTSAVFGGGVVAYATEIKARVLHVSESLLATRGAVDAEVAIQMSQGVLRLFDSSLALATTGVAGPARQDGHPVGQVFIAASWRADGGRVLSRYEEFIFDGDRASVRRQSVQAALRLGVDIVSGLPGGDE